jgi:hypothetical protein
MSEERPPLVTPFCKLNRQWATYNRNKFRYFTLTLSLTADGRSQGVFSCSVPSYRSVFCRNKWHANCSQLQFPKNKRFTGNARGQCECCTGQWAYATSHEMTTWHPHGACAVSPPSGAQLHANVSGSLSNAELFLQSSKPLSYVYSALITCLFRSYN